MGNQTWVSVYLYTAEKKEWTINPGHACRVFFRLHKRYGKNRTVAHWGEYLQQTPLQYLSLKAFEERFAAWAPQVRQAREVEEQLDLQMKRPPERAPRLTGDDLQRLHIDIAKTLKRPLRS